MNTKRLVLAVVFVSLLVINAYANVGIDWQNNNVMAINDGVTTNDVSDRDTFGQLLWTTNQSSTWVPESGAVSATDPIGTIYGSDSNVYLIDTFIVPQANLGSFPSQLGVYSNSHVAGQNINAGYIYAILYSDTNLNYLQTWFWVSTFTNTSTSFLPPPAPPSYLTLDSTDGAVPDGNGFVHYQFQLVPEPSSCVLFGLGTVSLLAFRRRRK